MQSNLHHSEIVKRISRDLGFSFCGISRAEFLEEEAPRLEAWLQQGMHGKMSYMENYFDKRLDPRLLVPGAKSIVSVLYNYFPEKKPNDYSVKISKYAYGEDYHIVIKDKLKEMMRLIQEAFGAVEGRAFVDSAPVLDKAWAKKGGLGWVGKNANIINKGNGSFFFIAELIIDLELAPDGPVKDYCGTCTACIDACPTEAIVQPYVVDGSKCISYLTIELKEQVPQEFKNNLTEWAFGCDICQDVCPWNRFSTPHQEPRFEPSDSFLNLSKRDWQEMTSEVFTKHFQKSPLKRAGLEKLKSTIFVE